MPNALGLIMVLAFVALFGYAGFILTRTMNSLAESNSYTPYKQYYSVPMKPEEIYQALSIPAIFGYWKSEFVRQNDMLYFRHFSGTKTYKYKVFITDIGHFSVLTLSQFYGDRSGLYVNVDAFLSGKLNATPIPNEVMKPHS